LERQRIQQAGGDVSMDRVDGQLAVSRALGDSNYKQSGDGEVGTRERQKSHKVIALADVSHLSVSAPDILLLACDGYLHFYCLRICFSICFSFHVLHLCFSIFEKLSNDSVAQFVFTEMSKPDADPALVASRLIDYSLKSGSRDNMSAIVVQLANGTAYHRDEDEFEAGPFFQFCENDKFRRCYEIDAARYGYSGTKLWHAAYKVP
jgi:serine/threonine protein phosphatase PrpC